MLPQPTCYFYIFCPRLKPAWVCYTFDTPNLNYLYCCKLLLLLQKVITLSLTTGTTTDLPALKRKHKFSMNVGECTQGSFLPPQYLVFDFSYILLCIFTHLTVFQRHSRGNKGKASSIVKNISSIFKNLSKLELSVYIKSRKLHYSHIRQAWPICGAWDKCNLQLELQSSNNGAKSCD